MGLRHLALLLDLSHEGTVYVLSPQQILLLLFALPVTWEMKISRMSFAQTSWLVR